MAQRAPNRDLVDRFEGRDAQGVRRYYFRNWNCVEKWKWGLSGLAILLCVGWLMAGTIGRFLGLSTAGNLRYSHGPVANVHAAWDNNCEACHRNFNESSGSSNPFAVRSRWLDLTCEKCHAGPVHHANMKWPSKDGEACSNCHHDHNGRDFSLVQMSDMHCTQCHVNLSMSHAGGKTDYAEKITDFVNSHPEFKKLQENKPNRTIKFSHALHMAPGQVASDPASDRGTKRLKDLSPVDQARYRQDGQTPDSPVQLTCASCHLLDAGRQGNVGVTVLDNFIPGQSKEAVYPSRAEGAYFLTVNFDAHCKACHQLGVTVDISGAKTKGTSVEVPHRKQPKELVDLLKGEFTRQLLNDNPELANKPAVPLVRLNPAGKEDETTRKFRQAIDDAVSKSQDKLFGQTNPAAGARSGATCTQCHELTNEKQIQAVKIPTVWFEHAKFSHVAHRSTKCSECHPTAYASPERLDKVAKNQPGWEQEGIHILGVESCKLCHSPSRMGTIEGKSGPVGGVRHDCTECHRYHNGDNPFQGRGGLARDPATPSNIAEFLRGSSK